MMKKLVLVAGGMTLLFMSMTLGILFAGPSLASAKSIQASTVVPTQTVEPNKYCLQFAEDLAKRLGIPLSKLQEARHAAFLDMLAQLVKDGKLTQAKADQIKLLVEKHQPCTGWRGHHFNWLV